MKIINALPITFESYKTCHQSLPTSFRTRMYKMYFL